MSDSCAVFTHAGLPLTVTHALPAPPQSKGVHPATLGVQTPVPTTQLWPPSQYDGRHGALWSTIASSSAQSAGAAGTGTFACAMVTFDRPAPLSPFSITRKAIVGLPATISIFE